MKKVTISVPAKINLTLDILGVKDGYHDLESLVASINVYDKITVKERLDGKITLKNVGLNVDCPIIENNAYKAAKTFIDCFGTFGVDIIVEKNIPVGGGLGGSSADIAGVLNAMNALYDVKGDLNPLAGDLGSDSTYMLTGGYAVIKGRGEIVESTEIDRKLYLLLIVEDKIISARSCYKKFDQRRKYYEVATGKVKTAMFEGDLPTAIPLFKNDLNSASSEILPEIKHNLYVLKKAGATNALVAGSGPTTFGAFVDKKSRDKAFNKLKALYGKSLIKAETVVKKDGKFI